MNGQGRENKGDNSYFYGEYQIGTKGNSPKNGCGVFVAYNSMITLGNYSNPADIIKYIDDNCGLVVDSGLLGINPFIMDNYFKDNGYDAYNVYLPSKNSLDELVKNNDSVIISYAWENNGTIGAHHIESHYNNEEIYTVNISNDGVERPGSISDYFVNVDPQTYILTTTVINKRSK